MYLYLGKIVWLLVNLSRHLNYVLLLHDHNVGKPGLDQSDNFSLPTSLVDNRVTTNVIELAARRFNKLVCVRVIA